MLNFDISLSGAQIKKYGDDLDDKDYLGGLEFIDEKLAYISHGDGRIVFDENGLRYQWIIKDHLGNNVVMFEDINEDGIIEDETSENENAELEVIQRNSYYAFGLEYGEVNESSANPSMDYKYNGKELHSDFDLGWSNYGARFYDPQVGRFMSVDAVQFAAWTPYHYVHNNPMIMTDPTGMKAETIVNPYNKKSSPNEYHFIDLAIKNLQKTSPSTYNYLQSHKSDFVYKFDKNIGNKLKGVTKQDITLTRMDGDPKLGINKILNDSNGNPFGAEFNKSEIEVSGLLKITPISSSEAKSLFNNQYIEDQTVEILLNPNNLQSQVEINSTFKHESGHAEWNMKFGFQFWMWNNIGKTKDGHDVHNPSGKAAHKIQNQ